MENFAKKSAGFLKDHSPVILTGVAASGVVATGILAAQGGMKAQQLLWEEHSKHGTPEDPKQRIKEDALLTWRCYIPAAVVGASTIAALVAGHSVSAKRQAAVVSLYSVTDRAFKEYKDQVIELIDPEKVEQIDKAVAAKNLADHPVPDGTIIIGAGKYLCLESLSGRYFETDYETIRAAQNDLNAQCINSVYASQNDWYKLLGLPPLSTGDELGWNTSHRLDVRITTTMTEDGRPALCLKYGNNPSPNYYKGHGWA